jgi:hypothetical protein
VAWLLEHETNVFQAGCARDEENRGDYVCKATHYGEDESRVRLIATVSASGDSAVVRLCETVEKVAPGKTGPCTEIR